MWLLLHVWPFFAAFLFAVASSSSSSSCGQLRIPSASIQHTLVHLDSFEEATQQAINLCARWKLPAHQMPNMVAQLLEAMEDMARHDASEALVNVTLDYTLVYSVNINDAMAPSHAPQHQDLTVVPERPWNETVLSFCERNKIRGDCNALSKQIESLVVRDWGCISSAAPASTEDAPASTEALPSPSPTPYAIREQDLLQEPVPVPLPVLSFRLDGTVQRVTVRDDQDLELQVALLCREWLVALPNCAWVMENFVNATKGHPAFATDHHHHHRGEALQITSPVRGTLYPVSQRVYYNGSWVGSEDNQTEAEDTPLPQRRDVCIYINYEPSPQYCGPIPPDEILYSGAHKLTVGYHIILFAEPALPPPPPPLSPDHEEPHQLMNQDILFLAARHFWVTEPTIELLHLKVTTHAAASQTSLKLHVETTSFDLWDPLYRVCVLVDDSFDCFVPSQMEAVENQLAHKKSTFHVPLFGVTSGSHTLTLFLMDTYNKCFASTTPLQLTYHLNPSFSLLPRNASFFFEPTASPRHFQRPPQCPPELLAAKLNWICLLWRHEWGLFSQNGEDGILQSIFHHLGTTNQYYVEFGTEDAQECNTRYLRQFQNWTGLLMDGSYENATIQLHKEWISRENINFLFTKYNVPQEFDLLSVDVDFNDYWILDAIELRRFSPRVIVIEINSHIPPQEPRVVKYGGASGRWDGKTNFFGVGVGAIHLWGTRNGYSLVYCESRGVNCFLVRDDVLLAVNTSFVVSEVLKAKDLHAPPNFFGRGLNYPPPAKDSGIQEEWVWLDKQEEE